MYKIKPDMLINLRTVEMVTKGPGHREGKPFPQICFHWNESSEIFKVFFDTEEERDKEFEQIFRAV